MNRSEVILLVSYLLVAVAGYSLLLLNLRHLRRYGDQVPQEFEGYIDRAALRKARDYTVEQSRFGIVRSLFDDLLVIVFFFGGAMNWYNSRIVSLNLPFVAGGIVFFLILGVARTVIAIPFSLYSVFRIENRYGFNTMTVRFWLGDFVKSLALSTVLLGIVAFAAFSLIETAPDFWWFFLWLFFLFFSIFMLYVSPYVIEPLFNKFSPLADDATEGSIRELMQKAGIAISKVFQMDASKRSRHTNAYFSGIGRVKRIVLYDTLLKLLNRGEILSVLAHEAGHWKKRHVLKRIFLIEALSLISISVSFLVLRTGSLGRIFAVDHPTILADLLILGLIGGIVTFPLTPLFSYLSRRHEREADRFAIELTGNPESAATSLIKLSKDNLSNLHPHPLYASFYYSHPPVVERVREIRGVS